MTKCESCGKELLDGAAVVRVQYGNIYNNVNMRRATEDDHFCRSCVESGNVAIRDCYLAKQ